MKFYTWVFIFLVTALGAHAYQTGAPTPTNFTSGQKLVTQKNDNYRAFSNYNNRNWGQGVQTQSVQTEVAGTSAVDFDKNTPQKLISKTQAATPAAQATPAATAKPAVASKPATDPAAVQQPAQAAATAANVDPSVMMQQVQGMMSAMSSMTGGGANGQPAANMPDISALMGGATPAAAPAKK